MFVFSLVSVVHRHTGDGDGLPHRGHRGALPPRPFLLTLLLLQLRGTRPPRVGWTHVLVE